MTFIVGYLQKYCSVTLSVHVCACVEGIVSVCVFQCLCVCVMHGGVIRRVCGE